MQFRFRRDNEGRETIHVGDVLVAEMDPVYGPQWLGSVLGLMEHHVHDAIERADEAGFWQRWPTMGGPGAFRRTHVVVNVSVPARTGEILSVGGEP